MIVKDQTFSMDYREQRSHARSVHPTQDTSHMGTSRAKQKEETDTKIMQKRSTKSGRKERRHEEEKSQTRPY